ncbi:unnamed protein product, partial [Ixodes pacificus]
TEIKYPCLPLLTRSRCRKHLRSGSVKRCSGSRIPCGNPLALRGSPRRSGPHCARRPAQVTAEPCRHRGAEKPAQSSAACVSGAMAPSRARSCPPPMVLVLLLAAKSSGYLHQDEAQEEVMAVAGGEVSLPCGAADNPFPGLAVGDEPCLLLWFREGSATPILSADARRGGGLHNAK